MIDPTYFLSDPAPGFFFSKIDFILSLTPYKQIESTMTQTMTMEYINEDLLMDAADQDINKVIYDIDGDYCDIDIEISPKETCKAMEQMIGDVILLPPNAIVRPPTPISPQPDPEVPAAINGKRKKIKQTEEEAKQKTDADVKTKLECKDEIKTEKVETQEDLIEHPIPMPSPFSKTAQKVFIQWADKNQVPHTLMDLYLGKIKNLKIANTALKGMLTKVKKQLTSTPLTIEQIFKEWADTHEVDHDKMEWYISNVKKTNIPPASLKAQFTILNRRLINPDQL